MTISPGSVDALLSLAQTRFYAVADNDEPGAPHSYDCDYEWMVSNREGKLRVDGLARTLHQSPADAYADATQLRDDILALGFVEQFRGEVMAARVEDMDTHATLGWRGRVDLGLRPEPAVPVAG